MRWQVASSDDDGDDEEEDDGVTDADVDEDDDGGCWPCCCPGSCSAGSTPCWHRRRTAVPGLDAVIDEYK